MNGRTLPDEYQFNSPADTKLQNQPSIRQAQEEIYKAFISLVNNYSSETVLLEFKQLFLGCDSSISSEGLQALYKIILNNDEEEFRNTLKRSCYILINNWSSQRKYTSIQNLIQLLAEATVTANTLSPSLKRLRSWVGNFINSEDYQELKLFASPYITHERGYWSHRYASYLLVPQYLDPRNPTEQRELARELSKRLKDKFKIELAMYTARSNSVLVKDQELSNPTKLGTGAIQFIKQVVSRNTLFDYSNQAHIFIQQSRSFSYKAFKANLERYLVISLPNREALEILKDKISGNLKDLYENHHEENLNTDLLLRTCRRVIEWLTIDDSQEPSYLFILLTSQETTLTLVVLLLKLVLICQYVRTHLEICIAKLIRYYEKYPENECQWFIDFVEIFNLVFAIYTENVQYNLVKVKDNHPNNQRVVDLDGYRIFSQLRGADLRSDDLNGADLRNSDLSAADLRGTNLHGADLSQADLSLAKLSSANMSRTIFNGAELIAADLNGADLSSAKMIATKLRCADLEQANLSGATLSYANLNAADLRGAQLRDADLQYADLSHANLSGANLSGANLQYANLSNANLQGANLTEANLSFAELEQVNLRSADLSGALLRYGKLSNANLSSANLNRTDLSYAELRYGDLSGANLSEAFLRHVKLSGADLSEANLRGANLFNTNLDCAKITNAQFGEKSELPELFEMTRDIVQPEESSGDEGSDRVPLIVPSEQETQFKN